jgi:hypothetical protein
MIPWRKPEPKISVVTSPSHSLMVTECVKGEFTMILAKSTFTNSSKWEGIRCILHKKPYYMNVVSQILSFVIKNV